MAKNGLKWLEWQQLTGNDWTCQEMAKMAEYT